jgi:peptidoglycan/xylan/chitin deacetylase (PgdA/CDA1 family)
MILNLTVRNSLAWLFATTLGLSGQVRRAKIQCFQNNVITPIYFHNPGKKLFVRIVTWLRDNGYVFVSFDQLTDILNKRMSCPRGAVWISFDDGWKGNIYNVIPVASQYDVPITVFIYTDAIEKGSFWWQNFRECASSLPPAYRDFNVILRSPENVRNEVLQLIARKRMGSAFSREAMTVDDVKSISAMPQVTIGSHTVTHPILVNCDDLQLDYELGESKRKLEDWTGKPVKAFAYPNGRYSGREKRYLEKYGYELAATIDNRFATLDDNRYLLPRTDVMDAGSFTENLCHALGVWGPFVTKLKRIL